MNNTTFNSRQNFDFIFQSKVFGHGRDAFRDDARAILQSMCNVYPASKVFVYAL